MPCKSMKVKILQGLKGCLVEIVCKVLQDNNDITTSEELSVEIEVYYNASNKGKSYVSKGCQDGVMDIPWFTCALVLNIIWSLIKKCHEVSII